MCVFGSMKHAMLMAPTLCRDVHKQHLCPNNTSPSATFTAFALVSREVFGEGYSISVFFPTDLSECLFFSLLCMATS